jgi:hypothetical protein
VNVDIEVTFKIKATDGFAVSAPPAKGWAVPLLGQFFDKITAHPCVLLILKEFMKGS